MKKALYTALALLAMVNVHAKETIKSPHPASSKRGSDRQSPSGVTTNKQCAAKGMGGTASLLFIENKGQIIDQHGKQRKDIDFKLDCGNMVLFIGEGELHYQWMRSPLPTSPEGGGEASFIYRMDVSLVGANKNAQVITEQAREYKENYYLPQCPNGATAHSFKKIVYKDVCPHIDWTLYISTSTSGRPGGASLKHEFIINPGGNPADIKLQYTGTTKLALADGELIAETPYGSIRENAPYTYYADNKQEITSSFQLNNNILSYNIAKSQITDHRSQIIIDPTLRWSTYYGNQGGLGVTYPTGGVCADTFGNVYMAGYTATTTNIATTGSHLSSYAGGTEDGFVVKFDSNGVRQWGTYYGGSAYDHFQDVETDFNGNVYLTGGTNSTSGIATSGAFQTSLSSTAVPPSPDNMLVKLNTNGVRQWGTYIAASGAVKTGTSSLACDGVGNIYVTSSAVTALATSGAYQTSAPPSGSIEGVALSKFNTNGVRQWTTMFNGDVYGMTCDGAGNLYIGGMTGHNAGVATTGSFQSSFSTGGINSFIVKFNPGGSRLWGTYFVGIIVHALACDAANNLFVVGRGGTGPNVASAGAYQTSFGGGPLGYYDGIIQKFNPTGTRLWGTYYGGTSDDQFFGVAIGPRGEVFTAGFSNGNSSLTTANAHKTTSGTFDILMTVFSNNGSRLYATYFGGTGFENMSTGANFYMGNLMAYSRHRVHFTGNTGTTTTTTGFITPGAHQTTYGMTFLTQFELDTNVYVKQPLPATAACVGDTLKIPFRVTKAFRSSNTFTLQLSNVTGSFASPTTIGSYTRQTDSVFYWIVPSTITAGGGYRVRILANAPFDTAYQQEDIYLGAALTVSASANTPLCSGNALNFTTGTITGAAWNWTGPNSYSSSTQNPSIANAQIIHSGDYYVIATLNGCISRDTVSVIVNQTPATPIASNNGPLCVGSNVNLTASTVPGATYDWTGPAGFTSTIQNPTISSGQLINAGTYSVTTSANGCTSTAANTPVAINQGPSILIYPSPKDTICAGRPITLNATVTNPGSGPGYQWQKNSGSAPGLNTGTTYTSAVVNDKDTFFLLLTPGAGAGCTTPVNSNKIVITVLPQMTPSVTITGTDSGAWPGLLVNFEATPTNGGNTPKYQWLVNNLPIVGAISDKWGTTTLKNGDSVCVALYSSYECPNPAVVKACKQVKIATGIKDAVASGVSISPNPFKDVLVITAQIAQNGSTLQLVDVYGRVVYEGKLTGNRTVINTASLPTGGYVLVVTDNKGEKAVYKVVKTD